ncbi:hypothetical protein OX283_011710 [Flavobacterium sp. SUN052]|uniref:hypothetical protein n=1 Tax=Flavobacterium sp. SUN052 TaxID=3002441 RepID=UPI00237E2ABE|nr:hypothetical protein [Flavobacterium sp. SUN052]MEC4005324.1 hypothetical protein [Flavobacterium sp. SUN052]
MKLNPKNGIDQLLFGMKQNDVIALYGTPDKRFEDDDNNIIFLYNKHKLRLTFYEDEDFRFGYIITSNPEATLLDKKVVGINAEQLKNELPFKSWELEEFDTTENHFNESNWLTLQSEYGTIIRVELGAIINEKDEFDWKFNTNKKGK